MRKKRNRGRSRIPFPDRIDATPEQIARALFDIAGEKIKTEPKRTQCFECLGSLVYKQRNETTPSKTVSSLSP
ncbi:MAG: hypothetical protein OXC80_13860 [Gammaproteobacteria bacterium]|nr:hypothetical protein [Gammaproteobacteria bacterium]